VDLTSPDAWEDLIPESESDLLEWAHCVNKVRAPNLHIQPGTFCDASFLTPFVLRSRANAIPVLFAEPSLGVQQDVRHVT
jgi:hypothetical protein